MFKKLTLTILFVLVSFFVFNFSFAEKVSDLKIDKYINDYAGFLSIKKANELNEKLYKHFVSTTDQVVLVTVNKMEDEYDNPDYIEHYSIKLAEKIKAGYDKKDNGVLFLISKDDRKSRIEVGYGLEPYLTDGKSNYILQNILKTEFQKNNYEAGIENSLNEIVKILEDRGEGNLAKPNSPQNKNSYFAIFLSLLPFILFFGVLFFEWLAAVLGRTKSWYLGGLIGAGSGLITFLFLTVYFSIFWTTLLCILGFVFDYFVSKNYNWHKKNPDKRGPPSFWSGGTWGPGSTPWTSSGNDYTFSGGGGGFGGGGASGDW